MSLAHDVLELGLRACDHATGVRGEDSARLFGLRLVLKLASVARKVLQVAVECLPRRVEKVDRVVAGVCRSAAVRLVIREGRGERAAREGGRGKGKDECASRENTRRAARHGAEHMHLLCTGS